MLFFCNLTPRFFCSSPRILMLYDFLIIGQGLAGSALAYQLLQAGQKVLVIDNQYANSASRVAAGLLNPITGNEMKKTWWADRLFPYLFQFYREIEATTGQNFLFPLPIYRPFESIEQQNYCLAESVAGGMYHNYLNPTTNTELYETTVFQPFGGIEILQAGYIDTSIYLTSLKEWFTQQQAYWQEEFDENLLEITDSSVTYKGVKAKKIIFCRGRGDAHSTFWSWLPFKHAKGDILQVNFANGKYEQVINKGCWIIPRKDGTYRVGSNYDWTDLTDAPSEKAYKEISDKLNKLTKLSYEVRGQQAGIRPTNSDRRPFIGSHPLHHNLLIFNGLGTKGVSLSPYFANHLVAHLLQAVPLESSVAIQRHLRLFPST